MKEWSTLIIHRQKPVRAWGSAAETPPVGLWGWLGILILAILATAPIATRIQAHLHEHAQRQRTQLLLLRSQQELRQAYLDLAAAHRRQPLPPHKEP